MPENTVYHRFLFKFVTNVIETHLKHSNFDIDEPEKAEDLAKESINTYETEEAEVAISMLNVFVEELKEDYYPYAIETAKILSPIIEKQANR